MLEPELPGQEEGILGEPHIRPCCGSRGLGVLQKRA